MKSNVCRLGKDPRCLSGVLDEVEKAAAYNKMQGKSALRLRLLAEELCGMLSEIIADFEGEFWLENTKTKYTLYVKLFSEDIDLKTKESLVSFSSDKENAFAKGIMGKIRAVAERMLLACADCSYADCNYGHYMGYASTVQNVSSDWSLNRYKSEAEENKDEFAIEELERSIVAKLADDIIVGVRGKNVEIIVEKTF